MQAKLEKITYRKSVFSFSVIIQVVHKIHFDGKMDK